MSETVSPTHASSSTFTTQTAVPPAMSPLDQILLRAEVLQRTRQDLAVLCTAVNAGIDALKRDHMAQIRAAIDEASGAWAALEREVGAHPDLFRRPKKIEAHGIVFGFEKGKGGLEIADPERTLKLIRKHLPDQAEVLIQTRESPAKAALGQLAADDLKRIGVEIKGTSEAVVIRPADGAIDKLVKALVAEAVQGEGGRDD